MNSLAWALFLAVSWTWCIGMYLPNLLARDGGVPFFLAFFVPNVLGAASVGFVLRTRDRSRAFVRALRVPMLVFSAVTVCFQVYFLSWKTAFDLKDGVLHLPAGIACGAAFVAIVALLRTRIDWVPALAAIACSLVAGVALRTAPVALGGGEPMAALLGLSMVTALGFGLCPYLDLSFNRAVQHAPSPRLAFGLGFFVFFAATILVVTRGRALWTPGGEDFASPFELGIDWILGGVGLHFGAQATFTILAHTAALYATRPDGAIAGLREHTDPRTPGRASVRLWIALPALVGWALGVAVSFVPDDIDLPGFASPIDAGELGYRIILGAYGLVFPAWMLLSLRRPTATDRATIAWTLAVCALAGPFLWIGAIGRDEVWLIPGVSIVVLAGAIRYATRKPASVPA